MTLESPETTLIGSMAGCLNDALGAMNHACLIAVRDDSPKAMEYVADWLSDNDAADPLIIEQVVALLGDRTFPPGDMPAPTRADTLADAIVTAGFYVTLAGRGAELWHVRIESLLDVEHDTYYVGYGRSLTLALLDCSDWIDKWIKAEHL